MVGVDVFIDHRDRDANKFGDSLTESSNNFLKLKMITNRGVKVYPGGMDSTFCTDHWRCRFISKNAQVIEGKPDYKTIDYKEVLDLMTALNKAGFDIIKTENLYTFDGKLGFSLGQGE